MKSHSFCVPLNGQIFLDRDSEYYSHMQELGCIHFIPFLRWIHFCRGFVGTELFSGDFQLLHHVEDSKKNRNLPFNRKNMHLHKPLILLYLSIVLFLFHSYISISIHIPMKNPQHPKWTLDSGDVRRHHGLRGESGGFVIGDGISNMIPSSY